MEAKRHVRVDHEDDNAYLEALIEVAAAHIDGPDPAWLGRALREQVWQLRLDAFGGGAVRLPLPPLQTVDAIEYVDADGVTQTLADFREFGIGSATGGGFILPAYNEDWPETRDEPEAVRITFTAGYTEVPKAAKHAALLLIGQWYESRENAGEIKLNEMPKSVDALLTPLRFWPST